MEQIVEQTNMAVPPFSQVSLKERLSDALRAADESLTPEELEAATILEWSDETLARGVRMIAKALADPIGFDGGACQAAVMVLTAALRKCNADRIEAINVTNDGRTYKIEIREVIPEPTDPRETLAILDAGKEDIEQYYAKLDETLAALKDAVGVGGYFQAEDGVVYKLVEPDGHFTKYRKLSYVRTKREGERAGTLSKKEADEWLALKGKLEALKGGELQWVELAPVDQNAAVVR